MEKENFSFLLNIVLIRSFRLSQPVTEPNHDRAT